MQKQEYFKMMFCLHCFSGRLSQELDHELSIMHYLIHAMCNNYVLISLINAHG